MNQRISTSYGKSKIYSTENQDPSSERVLVVPGYSESLAHSKDLVDALGATGLSALTFSQPRRTDKSQVALDPIQRQGNIVREILDATVAKGDKIHAVGHSLGSAAILEAALQSPERFASITLMQPVGMVGNQSFIELAGRVSEKVAKNQMKAMKSQNPKKQPRGRYAASADSESAVRYSGRVARAQITASGVIGKQPVLALKEASASGHYDIAEDLRKVAELGIPVNIVKAHGDEMFDPDKVDQGYEPIADIVNSYSSVADVKAGHDTFWLQPERTAQIVGQLILKQ